MRSCSLLHASVVLAALAVPAAGYSACCYFSAKDADIAQPAQKVFISWDPVKKAETFTVQPKFEGNALDFGMVIPTPTQPKLHEMPRDFFKHLAVYTILKKRESPHSKLLYIRDGRELLLQNRFGRSKQAQGADPSSKADKKPSVVVLEAVISREGVPTAIRVTRSLDPGLDGEAIAAAREWRFTPGRIGDAPVDVLVTILLDFNVR